MMVEVRVLDKCFGGFLGRERGTHLVHVDGWAVGGPVPRVKVWAGTIILKYQHLTCFQSCIQPLLLLIARVQWVACHTSICSMT